MAQTDNIANRRIPVKPATWEALWKLRKPGQSFDDMLREQIPAVKVLAESAERLGTAPATGPTEPEGTGPTGAEGP